jgi:antitoxin (DNA-binding transcriptional repressor) of toxin-antitoxin stability system
MSQLRHDGSAVITQNGRPRALLTPTSEETLLEDLQEQVRARARRAVSEIRRQAAKRGLDRLTMEDINREIQLTRKARRSRQQT